MADTRIVTLTPEWQAITEAGHGAYWSPLFASSSKAPVFYEVFQGAMVPDATTRGHQAVIGGEPLALPAPGAGETIYARAPSPAHTVHLAVTAAG